MLRKYVVQNVYIPNEKLICGPKIIISVNEVISSLNPTELQIQVFQSMYSSFRSLDIFRAWLLVTLCF